MDNQSFGGLTGFEKIIFEGIVRSFFIGQQYTDSSGYLRTEQAPMSRVTAEVAQKITPEVVKAIMREINVEALAKEIRSKVDIKAIEAEVRKEIKAKLAKRLST